MVSFDDMPTLASKSFADEKAASLKLRGRSSALIIFYLLGIGTLLPWNAFITAAYYYYSRFCATDFANDFISFFGIGYTFSQTMLLLACIKYQDLFPLNMRIMVPLATSAVVFILCAIFVGVRSFDPNALFAITLTLVLVCGCSTAILR
jgi:equilibrative nucleoside transporter 1/2/3